jgi:hypothetical protein
MPDNTLTLRLNGQVSLKKFAGALDRFWVLVNALSGVKKAGLVEWIVADLNPSSALTTIAGLGDPHRVVDVIDAYTEIGESLERGERVPYSPRIARPAYDLQRFSGNGIESVVFDTFRGDAVISATPAAVVVPPEPGALTLTGEQATIDAGESLVSRQIPRAAVRKLPPAYGSVSGQVETLARRTSLRFVLYDALHNKAVSCYVAEGEEDKMRDIWGDFVTVEGLITRDPLDGRPMSVRQITSIIKRRERQISYRDARGASPYSAVSPEDLVRRVRDAW